MDFTGARIVSETSCVSGGGAPAPAASPCDSCSVRRACIGSSFQADSMRAKPLIGRRRIKRGDVLYRAGDPFHFTFAVRSGTFKSSIPLADGRDQVTGFHFPGELMGIDGAAAGSHGTTCVSLEEGNVCALPFSLLSDGVATENLQRQLWSLVATKLLREREMLTLLANSSAEQRVSAFLVGLGDRMKSCGWSPREFHLRMRRADIASHLGMTVETVSRTLTSLADEGVIFVHKKHIRILDADRLEQQAPPAMRSPAFGEVSLV